MFHKSIPQKRRRGPAHARTDSSTARKLTAGLTALVLGAGILPSVLAPAVVAAPVGQGFTLNAGDMRFILKQIKVAENHATKENELGEPVSGQPLLGPGEFQIANPLLPYGLRTVDGTDNNLVEDQEHFGAGSLPFPRLAEPQWRGTADPNVSYESVNTTVTDAEPRFISNVIVDQTSSNPAAIAAAGNAHRTVNDSPTAVPCDAEGLPVNCVPEGETLDIPNVTTDFGLSPPYNGMFALFGQFFDHGIDFTKKTHNYVMIPLAQDDPLMVDGSAAQAPFMLLNRAENQPGPDGELGTGDDIQDGTNTDSPWVDQSQTYASHPSHHVFLREYEMDTHNDPVSTGEMLEGVQPDGTTAGMATWGDLKEQAATLLGMDLSDTDVGNVPMIATDQYGRFLRGPNDLPQYITTDNTLVEGNLLNPVAPPENVQRIGIAFLDDIGHNAAPMGRSGPLAPDSNTVTDDAAQPLPDPTTYDDEMLNAHFVAGDGRVNENIGLTAIHQVFHSEHNRLVTYMEDLLTELNLDLNEWQLSPGVWNGERIFQAARFVTEMEYQHIVFEDFARKIQPGINPFNVFTQADSGINPAIMAEFAHATYRFGHSMLTDTVDRRNNAGADISVPLLDAFLNPPAYNSSAAGPLTPDQAAGAIAMGMTEQVGAELDEFVTDTLRNNVLGLPLDLATLNIARGRETGVPSLNNFRGQLYEQTNESSLKPYTSWVDYGLAMKHPDSVVNFMAAYGTHPSILDAATIETKRGAAQLIFDMDPMNTATPADSYDFVNSTGTWEGIETGLNHIDLWVGGLAESQNLFGGLLGSTFNYIFERQMTDLQDGDRLYYLSRTSGMNLRTQLEGNSFAELIMRNTDAKALKADVFAVADCEFEMANITSTGGNNVGDDPASECDESALLLRMADGTIRYRVSNTVDRPGLNAQSTYNGLDTAIGERTEADRMWGGVDNDTFWGNGGNDIIEGNDGADTVLGGEGDDIITDSHGDDVLKGGPGNDAIDAGPGLDIIMSGDGDDFSNGGLNGNETFAGEGNDLAIAGDGPDAVFGGGGDDWLEGGNANDLLQGDSGAPFFDDINDPGHDVLIGDSGEDDYDAEGGDDIMVAGPGIERNHGVYGFDWVTHARSVEAANSDLRMIIVDGPNALEDRHLLVEGLSGWDQNDVLRGTDVVPSEPDEEVGVPGLTNELNAEGIARIDGLADLLPAGATTFGAGNIIIGGTGSDQIWGYGADDVIDGDKWLNVRLSVRTDVNDPATEIRTVNSLTEIQADIMNGTINPGNVAIVREVITPAAADTEGDVDTAIYTGARDEYEITTVDGVTTVAHTGGTGDDGTDTLTNVELLQFTDVTEDLDGGVTAPTDTTAPTVTERSPADGAIGVSQIGNITVTFDEAVTGVDASTFRVSNPQGNLVAGAITYDAATNTATLDPSTSRLANTAYTVRLTNGIADTAGNPLEATSWTYTTGTDTPPATDTTAPTVTDRSPAAGATGVSQTSNISVTFSEAVTGVSSSTFRVTNERGDAVAGTVYYNTANQTVTLYPYTSRLANTVYTVELADGITDTAGNALAATSWTYTTGTDAPPVVDADTTAPTVTGQSPAPDETGVSQTSNISVTFSEAVTGTDNTTFRVTNSRGDAVAGTVYYNTANQTVTLYPYTSRLANTVYTVELADGITDTAGNALAATSWTYTTGTDAPPVVDADTTAPTVTGQSPAPDETGVSQTSNISVTFSEAVTGTDNTTFRVTNSRGDAVAGTVWYNSATQTVTLYPYTSRLAQTVYTVELTAGIEDTAGNALPASSWTYTTGTD